MTTKERSCAKRLPAHRDSRLATLEPLVTATEQSDLPLSTLRTLRNDEQLDLRGDLMSDAMERLYELPLSVETLRVVKVLLSTGGPADWFEATIDSEGDIIRIEYVLQDWFDDAREELHGSDFYTAEAFVRHVAALE